MNIKKEKLMMLKQNNRIEMIMNLIFGFFMVALGGGLSYEYGLKFNFILIAMIGVAFLNQVDTRIKMNTLYD